MYQEIIKPFADKILALLLLLLLSPVIAISLLAVFVFLGQPLFFRQERPGKGGKIFTIYKLRTMSDEKDETGELLPDEQRLHGLGKVIRSLSLDELPQLINILKGEMSFIGPRPLLIEYLPLYNEEQKRRHDVKPGITGWAQVNGRNAIPWKKKFEYDVFYVDHISFVLDMKIIWMTIKKVILREGITSSTHATVEKFNGYN